MTGPRRRRLGSRLFAMDVIASMVPIGGAALVPGEDAAALAFGSDVGRAQGAVIEEIAIAPPMRGTHPCAGLKGAVPGRLQSATHLRITDGSVSHLRLPAFTGTVEFRDDTSVAGSASAGNQAFRVAAAGGTDVQLFSNLPTLRHRHRRPAAGDRGGEHQGHRGARGLPATRPDRHRRAGPDGCGNPAAAHHRVSESARQWHRWVAALWRSDRVVHQGMGPPMTNTARRPAAGTSTTVPSGTSPSAHGAEQPVGRV
jgi:hypothetical protein